MDKKSILVGALTILILVNIGGIILFIFREGPLHSNYSLFLILILSNISVFLILIFTSFVFSLFGHTISNQALGLPPGSIRAFIALGLIISFLTIAVFIYNGSNTTTINRYRKGSIEELDDFLKITPTELVIRVDTLRDTLGTDANGKAIVRSTYEIIKRERVNEEAMEIGKEILTILSTLVVAVSAFYFGSRAAEEGGKLAKETLIASTISEMPKYDVTEEIVKRAIYEKKDDWKATYMVKDIRAGRKKVHGTETEQFAIVFYVETKVDQEERQKRIPPYIDFFYNEHTYSIPTDVQT